MRAGIVALLTILAVVAVSAEEKNPIRDIRARYKAKLEKWEKFFEEDPLGQKISDHYAELKELIKEVRQRIRKQLAKYIKQLKSE
uniref:Hydrophobic ligand binding protein n=1 Tax=Echinococcus granulosus TaxID=6210 RepID=A0A068WMS7_ECHGR|nr:hydrophobic ligand binding protein [Echinococcus granulosus]